MLTGIRFLAFWRLRVYTRLSPTEPFRCIFPLRDGPNDSLLPSASPERCNRRVSPSVFSDTAASRGRFRPFSYYPSRGYPVGTGSRAILPSMAPKSRRVRWLSASSSE